MNLTGLFGRTLDLVLGRGRFDPEDIETMEEALLSVDCGPAEAADLAGAMREWVRRAGAGVRREVVYDALARTIAARLSVPAKPDPAPRTRPFVEVFVGANGTGKTTTLAKRAARVAAEGKRPLLAACDTFRAAAAEQLAAWAERLGVPIVSGKPGADPASVAFDALSAARARGCDWVGVDTAGRLANKEGLLRELEKILRVVARWGEKHAPEDPPPPDAVLLVVDAATGQAGVREVEGFARLPLSGLAVTKLDGAARGGFVLPAVRRFGVPVRWIGTGEGIEDLHPFDAEAYARALVGTA